MGRSEGRKEMGDMISVMTVHESKSERDSDIPTNYSFPYLLSPWFVWVSAQMPRNTGALQHCYSPSISGLVSC